MHELNASEGRSSRPERLEPHHRSHLTLDCSVVLFNNVVEVLDLADFIPASCSVVVSIAAVLAPLLSMVFFAGGMLADRLSAKPLCDPLRS